MKELRDLVNQAQSAHQPAEQMAAFAELVKRFRSMACAYAFSILGDLHLAEDAAQDAFVLAFQRLRQLRQAEGFPGWLRRIVASACGRMTRRPRVPTTALEAAHSLARDQDDPASLAERHEISEEVLRAIATLSAANREVTVLFYLGEYSQKHIAEFLDIPLTTVKNRLHASRTQLKERMMTMVEDTLRQHVPDDRFDRAVVERLLAEPDLLTLPGHPLREIYEAIRAALPEYEEIQGDEVIPEDDLVNPWLRQFAVPAGSGKMLRPETTATTLAAITGRTAPVRLITGGRQFHHDFTDKTNRRVLHGMDLVCVAQGAGEQEMKATADKIVAAVFGPRALRYEATTLPSLSPCYKIEAEFGQQWRLVAGCGVFKPDYLRQRGIASEGGFAIGSELENLALIKQGLKDARGTAAVR
jgi:RNA polymerase sigma factor (sigma-70 family)